MAMWLALTTTANTNVVININRVDGIWEQKDGSSRLVVNGEDLFVRDAYKKIVAAIQTAQTLIHA